MKLISSLLAVSLVFVFSSCQKRTTHSSEQEKNENDSTLVVDDKDPNKLKVMAKDNEPRVTGVGGIFFKSANPEELKTWYQDALGLVINEYGSTFEFRDSDTKEKGTLQWSPFGEKTTYFEPSQKEFMVNYRVQNIEALVEKMKGMGVTVVDSIETYEYGKFVHVMDPEGNKIELWEPVDSVFAELYEGKTTK